MQGYAYRCDNCGRVAFVPEPGEDDLFVPPPGWLGVSEVAEDGTPGAIFSFCTWLCLSEKAQKMLPSYEEHHEHEHEHDDHYEHHEGG